MPIYNLAWGVVVIPLLGVLSSFLAETQRRAVQICFVFSGLAFVMAAIVLGVRLTHAPAPAFDNVITFFAFNPPETKLFAARFEPLLGVHVDALSAAFGAAISFVVVVVQGYALTSLRGEHGYRRFFWASSALAFTTAGFVFSPNLFQALFMMGAGSAAIYLLLSQWWDRADHAAPARRVLVLMTAGNAALLLATAVILAKSGQFAATLTPPPAGQDITDPYAFTTLARTAPAILHGMVHGAGLRTLVLLGILVLFAAMVRAGLFPFHVWLTETAAAPTPAIALLAGIGTLPGIYLLARTYSVIAISPHLPVAIALVGAGTAIFASITCLAQRDILRIALFAVLTQLGVAVATLGSGGYSAAMFVAFSTLFFTTLLLLVAANLMRVYRTRNIHEMGGAWGRMRTTSIALLIWAAATGGLGLTTYYALASAFANRSPVGGQIGGVGRGVVVALLLLTAVATALLAFRLVAVVCTGEVVRRRGFQAERVAEVERPLRSPLTLALVASVASVLAGLPGIAAIHSGKLSVPGLTFTHFVFFGAHRQSMAVDALALLLVLLALAIGAGAAWYMFGTQRRERAAHIVARYEVAVRVIARGLFVERTAHRAGQPLLLAAQAVERFDATVPAALSDSAAAGTMLAAASFARVRPIRIRVYLTAALLVAGVLTLLALLAATGHFWIHTV